MSGVLTASYFSATGAQQLLFDVQAMLQLFGSHSAAGAAEKRDTVAPSASADFGRCVVGPLCRHGRCVELWAPALTCCACAMWCGRLRAVLHLLTLPAARLQSLETALAMLLPARRHKSLRRGGHASSRAGLGAATDAAVDDTAAAGSMQHDLADNELDPELGQARDMVAAVGAPGLTPYEALDVCRRRADVRPSSGAGPGYA